MRLSLAQPQGRLFWGQAVLVACCLFYVCFWRAAFHPYRSAAVPFGGKAALFLCTLLCGIGGVALTVSGISLVGKKPVSQALLVVGGAAAYVVLLLLTTLLWKRRVTTELVLLVAWTVLELSALNALYGAGFFGKGGTALFAGLCAAALLGGLWCYLRYDQLPPLPAFFLWYVPLLLDAAVMAGLCAAIFFRAKNAI